MKLDIERDGIHITPENYQDQIYLEEICGLKKHRDSITVTRDCPDQGETDEWGFLSWEKDPETER